jgi:hypothetical protein
MRFLIIIILLSRVQFAICQSDTLGITITEIPLGADESPEYVRACNEERMAAIEDIRAGILKVENYIGLTFEKKDFGFEDFYTNYLISKYGIEQVTTGCMSARSRICYFEEMNKAIAEMHGLTLDKLRNAAKQEYEKFKLLDAEVVKRYIDFNYVYEEVDMITYDPAGQKHFTKQLKSKIDLKKLRLHGYKLKDVYLEVVVDEAGDIVDCKIISMNFPSEVNVEIENAVKKIGGWKPAELYGLKVKSRIVIYF